MPRIGLPIQGTDKGQSPVAPTNDMRHRAKIKELSQDFESVFLELLTSNMRKSIQKSGLVSGGNGEDIFQGLLDAEYAKTLSAQKMTGLADAIESQLMGMSGGSKGKLDESLQKNQGLKAYALQKLRLNAKQGKID